MSSSRHGFLARMFFGEIPLLISDSLVAEPGRWSCPDGYRLRRDDGITVWVANRAYGLSVIGRGLHWGDVTMLSSFGLSPGHRLLWRAADRWILADLNDAPEEASPRQLVQPIREAK